MSQPFNPGFRVFDPAEPEVGKTVALPEETDRPLADVLDETLTDLGADLAR